MSPDIIKRPLGPKLPLIEKHSAAFAAAAAAKSLQLCLPTVLEGSLFSTPSPAFIVCRLLMMTILTGVR